MSGVQVADQWVQQAQQLASQKRGQLASLYPEGVAAAAISRAWESARRKVEPIRSEVRSQAFYDLLVAELPGTEEWCRKYVQGMQT